MPNPHLNPTAREFLAARARWLRTAPIATEDGSYAVALVIDGRYTDADHAEQMADHFGAVLDEVLRHEGITVPDPVRAAR